MKTFSFLFVVIFILTNISCVKVSSPKKIICQGNIYDTIGGPGVAGINVTLSACIPNDGRDYCTTYSVGKTTTDASGHYYINGDAASWERYFIAGNGIKFQELKEKDLQNSYYTTGYLKK